MGTARPLHKVDRLVSCEDRVLRLEQQLTEERALRKAAEINATRFHALMLQARVKLITEKKRPVGGDVT